MHFTVAIITDKEPTPGKIEEMMEPYSESLEVERYWTNGREEEINRLREALKYHRPDTYLLDKLAKKVADRRYCSKKHKEFEEQYNQEKEEFEITERMYALLKEGLDEQDDSKILQFARWAKWEVDDELNGYSTYNPNAKWDWYQIGGRWEELIPNNCCQIKDIKNNTEGKSEEELIAERPDDYARWLRIQDGTINSFYKAEYLQKLYPTFKDYARQSEFTTYAVLDDEGWKEPGEMGWFASTATPEGENEWYASYYDNFLKNNGEKWITVVDCHI